MGDFLSDYYCADEHDYFAENYFDREAALRELESLPKGYISNKVIGGKVRHYLQWNDGGKIRSRYIKDSEYEDVKAQIARRKELAESLRKYAAVVQEPQPLEYGSAPGALTGMRLQNITAGPMKLKTRDCFADIEKYIYGPVSPRIMVIYGLRRTGKTTLLLQAVGHMKTEDMAKAFYIKARKGQTMAGLYRDIDRLYGSGYRYGFIDEITFIDDFVDTAGVLADIYAAMGMKLVISGTDSLGLWLAGQNELYDRTYTIHTTRISYAEHAKLLNTEDVDDYIRFGGTLRAGEYDFDDPELRDESISFRDDESTRRYIDTAICMNIQHSLKCYESGTRFLHLQELYEAGELANAINRVIEDMNHRFVLSVLQNDFVSADFALARKNLLREKNPALRTDILEKVDLATITARLMEVIHVKNKHDTGVGLKPVHAAEIRDYLSALDLIDNVPVRYAYGAEADADEVIITQPGIRYCQAEALVWSLGKDTLFAALSETEKDYVIGRILEEVKGRMLEEIVLADVRRALTGRRYDVFRYRFHGGEIDMVIYDSLANTCRLYEIKHAVKPVIEQCRHLLNEQECARIELLFGKITDKAIIYRGEKCRNDQGIEYLNASNFLRDVAGAVG